MIGFEERWIGAWANDFLYLCSLFFVSTNLVIESGGDLAGDPFDFFFSTVISLRLHSTLPIVYTSD